MAVGKQTWNNQCIVVGGRSKAIVNPQNKILSSVRLMRFWNIVLRNTQILFSCWYSTEQSRAELFMIFFCAVSRSDQTYSSLSHRFHSCLEIVIQCYCLPFRPHHCYLNQFIFAFLWHKSLGYEHNQFCCATNYTCSTQAM